MICEPALAGKAEENSAAAHHAGWAYEGLLPVHNHRFESGGDWLRVNLADSNL